MPADESVVTSHLPLTEAQSRRAYDTKALLTSRQVGRPLRARRSASPLAPMAGAVGAQVDALHGASPVLPTSA